MCILEVADGGRLHPLKRFSGGEQDLAALCLRVALSRTPSSRQVQHCRLHIKVKRDDDRISAAEVPTT